MGKKPDAVYCSLFAGDFVTFTKEATPLGYFKAIDNRLVDGAEVGTTDEAQALGQRLSLWHYRRRLRPGDLGRQRAARPQEIHRGSEGVHPRKIRLRLVDCRLPVDLGAGRGHQEGRRHQISDDVAKALPGLTFDTPVGKRTFSVKSHETFAPEYWGVMVKEAAYPFAVIKNPELLPPTTETN